ncbi:MAG: hypothetical protein ACI8T1_003859 [Verrucomicrobiales bacterium]|jgi:hypothetical protein
MNAFCRCLSVLLLYSGFAFATVRVPAYLAKAKSETRGVGRALHAYAEANDGRLPASIRAIPSDYGLPREVLEYVTLTVPNAILNDLPKDCMIAFRPIPEDLSRIVATWIDTPSAHRFGRLREA